MKTERISYQDLPGQNRLFLSFVNDWERVRDWYPSSPRTLDDLVSRKNQVLEADSFSRRQLVNLLRRYHETLGADGEVVRNLDRLEKPETIVVVAGQQAGLFGGPCYTVYKAATVIRIVQDLRARGLEAVPVFWMATDDSDFEEIRRTNFVDSEGRLVEAVTPDRRARAEQMAGTALLEGVESFLGSLDSRMGSLDFPLAAGLDREYRDGRTYGEAFARWMLHCFEHHGLVLFDPLMKGYRSASAPFFRTVIEKREEILDSVLQRNEAIARAGFTPQVHVEPTETFLFVVQGDCRYKLEFSASRFVAKGRKTMSWSRDKLLGELDAGEVELGPTALLRPVLQDYLLPSVLTIGGAAEVAYFSQVNALSRFWNRDAAIFPRAGFTVIDRKSQRLLKKHGLSPLQVLGRGEEALAEHLVRAAGKASSQFQELDEIHQGLTAGIDRLRKGLESMDPTVAALLEGSSRKIYFQLDKVRRRLVSNTREQDAVLARHIEHLRNHLCPGGGLQERTLNFNYFRALEGTSLLERVVEVIQPFNPEHQFLYL